MSHVRLLRQISGGRDGAPWPAPGEVLEVEDDEANDLVAAELAEHADAPKSTKAAVKPEGK